jgi:hypothetical protein
MYHDIFQIDDLSLEVDSSGFSSMSLSHLGLFIGFGGFFLAQVLIAFIVIFILSHEISFAYFIFNT